MQQFLQFDFDTNGDPVDVAGTNGTMTSAGRANDVTFLYYSLSAGYWLYNNPDSDRLFNRIAPIAELHYNRSLQKTDVVSANGYQIGNFSDSIELLNATVGMTALMGQNKTLTAGYVTPLGGGSDKQFNGEFRLIFNWFFGVMPVSVAASGGVDYYKEHEWYDNAMCIYEYKLPEGMARAFYQVQTTTSAGGGYWEYFMGDQGSIKMSENPSVTQLFQEANAPDWSDFLQKKYLIMKAAAPAEDVKVDVRESKPLMQYALPGGFNKAIHQPHLENFFNAIRGTDKLNCPADEAFRSESVIHKASEAIAARRTLEITPADYTV